MKWQRSLSVAMVAFLMLNGSVLGSESAPAPLQVRWGELKKVVGKKKITLHLSDGERLEGKIRKVRFPSLIFKIKRSSDPVAYPKGKVRIPRAAVSRIEVRGLKHAKTERNSATVATFLGAFLGSFYVVRKAGSDSGMTVAEGVAVVAIPVGAAILVYRALTPKDVTRIEILSDSPGKGVPKPANKDTSLNTTIPAGTAPLFFETSSPGPLRQQVLQALMRQDRPFRLQDQESAAK